MDAENEKTDCGPEHTLEHPGHRPIGEMQGTRHHVIRHLKSSVYPDRRPGRPGDKSDNQCRYRESARRGKICDVLQKVLLTSLGNEVEGGESQNARNCCEARLTQGREEPTSPDYLLRNPLEKECLSADHHGRSPPRQLRSVSIFSCETEYMDDTGNCNIHGNRSEDHPHHPEQGLAIETQAQADTPTTIKRTTQRTTEYESQHYCRTMSQENIGDDHYVINITLGIRMREGKRTN